MTFSQFANDTAGLIDALGIQKPVDVLGVSLGRFIAQELAFLHPKLTVPARPAPFAATPSNHQV